MKPHLLLAGLALAVSAPAANAAVNIYISDNGTDTLVQVMGTINLAGFTAITPYGTEPGSDEVQGHNGILYAGDPRQGLQAYAGLTNGNNFGNFNTSFANSGTGTGFGINGAYSPPRLLLARTYVSGDTINSTATFLYRTLADLGLTAGDYTYVASSDTITLHVGQAAPAVAAVPEPASWALMVAGFGAIGATLRSRRTRLRFA